MSHPPRWILVDDTNTDIKYTGSSWFSSTGNPISNEDWGLPYQDTLHGTNSNASLAYNFTGSAVRVIGTIHLQNISGVIDPSWECFVDGTRIGNLNVTSDSLNNYNYCEGSGLNDGLHTLTVTTTTRQQTFWFDRIEYAPSAGVPLEGKTVMVSTYSDPALQYSFGWNGGETDVVGSSVSLDFVGTSLIWYTEYDQNSSTSRTTATWTIDNQEAQNATLPEHNRGSNLFNQKLFDTGTLAIGTHRLTVTYNGASNANTPLSLAYLYIQNGTTPSPSTTSSAPSSTAASSANSRPGSMNMGAIIGATVTMAALLLIILIAYCFYRCRRHSRRYQKHESFKKSTPYVESPNLRYTYYAAEGRQMPNLSSPVGANRAINPSRNPTNNRQATLPARPTEGAVADREVAVRPHVAPEGTVIDLPPAYSLN